MRNLQGAGRKDFPMIDAQTWRKEITKGNESQVVVISSQRKPEAGLEITASGNSA